MHKHTGTYIHTYIRRMPIPANFSCLLTTNLLYKHLKTL